MFLIKIRLVVGMLLVSSVLIAKDSDSSSDLQLSSNSLIEMGVSPVVNGCVNTITGDFVDSSVDLVIPGPEPLIFQRNYASSYNGRCLYNGWRHNHVSWIKIMELEHITTGNKTLTAQYMERSGRGTMYYNRWHLEKDSQILTYNKLDQRISPSNCCEGTITARNNPNFIEFEYYKKKKDYDYKVSAKTASGSDLKFEKPKYLNEEVFFLSDDFMPNRRKVHYNYNGGKKLHSIRSTNYTGDTTFGLIRFHYPKETKLDEGSEFYMESSDGRRVSYKLKQFKYYVESQKTSCENYLISEVNRPNGPKETYEYTREDVPLMTKRMRPCNRYTEIVYNSRQVSHLKAPVGTDSSPITTYRFSYKMIEGSIYDKGQTEVYDALNHLSKYVYNHQFKLRELWKYTGVRTADYKPYSREVYVWGDEWGPEAGYLQTKYVFDGTDNVYSARSLEYDAAGNVIKDTFYGDITGKSTPVISGGRFPIENGCDRFGKKFKYGLGPVPHLMTEEVDDNGIGALYSYVPNTELLASKLITDHGVIKVRNFNEYDAFGVLIKAIIDDGSTSDQNNLTDVSQRLVTYTTPRKTVPIGLPECIDEKYLDLKTGQEVLLKSTRNFHSLIGRLEKQEIYDANAKLAYTLEWTYDSHGNVETEKNALGQVTFKRYDDNDNMISRVDRAKEFHTVYNYDYSNRLVCSWENHNDVNLCTYFRYDYLGNKIGITDAFSNETNFTYDEFGRIISTQYPAIPDQYGNLIRTGTSCRYDLGGNVIEFVDQRNEVTRSKYNVYGKPTEICYPDGCKETFEYNLNGTVRKSTAKNGMYTLFTYDGLQHQIKKEIYSSKNELLSTASSVYNAFHQLSSTDAEGITTYYKYDGAGRIISTSCGDQLTTCEYDERGRVCKTTEKCGADSFRVKKHLYDVMNRLITETIEDSKTLKVLRACTFTYDANNNVKTKTLFIETNAATTITEFDSHNQPIKVTDAEGNVTHTKYNYGKTNAYGQRVLEVTTIDPLGNQVVTTMNALLKPGMVVKKNAMGQELSKKELFYSGTGDCQYILETVMTPGAADRQVITSMLYDYAHKIRHIYEAYGSPEQKHTEIIYNEYGQKSETVKPDGTRLYYDYDQLGRLASIRASDSSLHYTYKYDGQDNPIEVTDELNSTKTTRSYDKNQKMESETLGSGVKIRYEYDPLDRPILVTFPDDSRVRYEYDAMNLNKIHRINAADDLVYSHTYDSYDLAGNLSKATLAGNAGSETVKYDLLSRVVASSVGSWTESIAFDAVGNLKEINVQDAALPVACKYSYDDMYQLQSETGNATHQYVHDSLYNCVSRDGIPRKVNILNQLIEQGDIKFTYDLNGNRSSKEENGKVVNYAYDALDRLISVLQEDKKWTYTYDSFNRRLKTDAFVKNAANQTDWQHDNTTLYFYQGQNEVGSCDAEGNVNELRILGVGKGAEIGASIAFEIQGAVYAPIHDHNGNVISLIDSASGDTVERYQYSAFGEEKVFDGNGQPLTKSTLANPWRFSSKRVDTETGFVHFGRRHYDPMTSRWTSPDPIGFEGGPNLYAYVMNSPLNHFDLYGLQAVSGVGGRLRNAFSSAWNYGAKALSGLSRAIGEIPLMDVVGGVIESIGRNLIPIPIAEGAIRSFGNFLKGGGSVWKSCTTDHHSYNYTREVKDNTNGKVAYVYSNGMLNTIFDAWSTANTCSSELGIQIIHCLYNCSHGLLTDLDEILCQKLGLESRSVQKAVTGLREALGSAERVIYEAHSQGGLVAYRALEQLTPEERIRIDVITYGSAKIIDKDEMGLSSATNYVSRRDAVPFISDPAGCYKGWKSNYGDVRFLKSNGWPLIDHGFDCKTYKDARQLHHKELKAVMGVNA